MSANNESLAAYYRLHARVYDATRWSFLFGRERLLKLLAAMDSPHRILEIGCGTGRNLLSMCDLFPSAEITGIDLSGAMIDKAWTKLRDYIGRVKLINEAYDHPLHGTERGFDLIVCSYALSMFNPGWERAIECAKQDLAPGGHFALVDFHDSEVPAFRRWMQCNHVRMEGHLQPMLRNAFRPIVDRVQYAYGGLWRYHTFVGRRSGRAIS